MATDPPRKRRSRSDGRITCVALGAIVCVVIAWTVFGFRLLPQRILALLPEGSGWNGFEAANALFAGLAFACLIWAIFLQRDELGLQRRELRFQRRELKRTASAQERSEESLRQQVGSMVLGGYLNALNSVRESYQRAELSAHDSLSLYSILAKMEEIVRDPERFIRPGGAAALAIDRAQGVRWWFRRSQKTFKHELLAAKVSADRGSPPWEAAKRRLNEFRRELVKICSVIENPHRRQAVESIIQSCDETLRHSPGSTKSVKEQIARIEEILSEAEGLAEDVDFWVLVNAPS